MGYGIFVIIIIISIVASVIKKAAKEGSFDQAKSEVKNAVGQIRGEVRGSGTSGGNSAYGASGYGAMQKPRYDSQTGLPLPQYGQKYNPTVDTHLCDDNEHGPESEKSYSASMYELEEGYQGYTAPPGGTPAPTRSKYNTRQRRLTGDELRRKENELRDLRDAGIISNAEYTEKMREYQRG